jgi:DNA-binding NarL/FixJ family response regulator
MRDGSSHHSSVTSVNQVVVPRPRVLLCDDHGLIVEGLRNLLEKEFDVIGVTTNGRDLVSEVDELNPDAVLLDVSMPVLNGMEAARQIKARNPNVKLVFVTQKADREYVQTALRIGASGYVLKQAATTEVSAALHEVLAGRYYVTPSLRKGIPDALYNPNKNPSELFGNALTPRQREVLQLVAEGKSNKEVAAILKVSVKTVDFHKAAIMEELGLRSTAELTRYALEQGIVGD